MTSGSYINNPLRAGFSLIEAMFALAILAIVLSGLIGNIGTLNNVSSYTDDQQVANDLLRKVYERFQSVDFELINATDHWSRSRTKLDAIGGLTLTDLNGRDLEDRNLRLNDIEFFIEYYRAIDGSDGAGMMQRFGESDADYRVRVNPQVLDGSNVYRLLSHDDLARLQDRPVVIRLTLKWGDQQQKISLMTTRRRSFNS